MRDLVDQMGGGHGRPPRDFDNEVESVKSCDLDLVLHWETNDAFKFSETGEEARAIWLPKRYLQTRPVGKSVAAIKRDGQRAVLPVLTVTLPIWLAKDKGLI